MAHKVKTGGEVGTAPPRENDILQIRSWGAGRTANKRTKEKEAKGGGEFGKKQRVL